MNALQEFKFNNSQIRVINVNGDPYWVAKDVANALGYNLWNINLVSHVPDEWKGVNPVNTLGGIQEMICLSEQGLYFFLNRSDKKSALPFQKWVNGSILPQIRKTGSYSLPSDPHDQVLMLCEKLTQMTIEAKQLTQKLIEHQPKVDAWQKFIDSDKLIDLAHIAQVCKTGRNLLYEKMREENVFFYKGQYNSVYQQYIDQGYFAIKFKPHPKLGPIPVIKATPKGAEWIYTRFYRKQVA